MSLSTKGVEGRKAKLPFVFPPGQHIARITEVKIAKYPNSDNDYFINVLLEGEEIDDFEGFQRDINDPSKGKFKGQMARVSLPTYVKKGTEASLRDPKMIASIVDFVKPLGLRDEVDEIQADSWEEFGEKLTEIFRTKGTDYYVTLAARKKEGPYNNYDRYQFPNADYINKKYPVAVNKEDALPFNEETMVELPKKTEEVSSFETSPFDTDTDMDEVSNSIFG